MLHPDTSAMFQRAGMLSPEGRCKALDAAADGYVRGEAAGVMLLSAFEPGASATQAPIAVLSGAAVNQDGRSSALTAPNGPAQQEVVRSALAAAGLQAASIAGLSMHGTGTPLGDPIEVGAAAAVLTEQQKGQIGNVARQPISLLASKSWFGHSEPSSGVVGLMLAASQLTGSQLPPISHLTDLNPNVAAVVEGGSCWVMPRQTGPSPSGAIGNSAGDQSQQAVGTSAFAFQGTNAHVLMEAPQVRVLIGSF